MKLLDPWKLTPAERKKAPERPPRHLRQRANSRAIARTVNRRLPGRGRTIAGKRWLILLDNIKERQAS